jgi:hypothetical protein
VINWLFPILALILLAIPPIIQSFRGLGFERARWQESDYPQGSA